jgi:two-component system NtrC family sensor kinase
MLTLAGMIGLCLWTLTYSWQNLLTTVRSDLAWPTTR